ncbi:ankyrin repeat domain-containing protein [Candidatus Micrarchaeota archaeon]|nr:ankyrin repeat domain-containing protein [Candidatus Micrarchaeota archaeon]
MGVPKFQTIPPESGRLQKPSTIRTKLFNANPMNSFYPQLDRKLIAAIKKGNLKTAKMLIESGADPNTAFGPMDDLQTSPLKYAASTGNKEILEMLIDFNVNLNYRNESGSALFDSIFSGNSEITAILLFEGSNPNETLKNGTTPLMLASRLGLYDVAELLILSKAELELTDYLGRSAIDFAKDKKMRSILLRDS